MYVCVLCLEISKQNDYLLVLVIWQIAIVLPPSARISALISSHLIIRTYYLWVVLWLWHTQHNKDSCPATFPCQFAGNPSSLLALLGTMPIQSKWNDNRHQFFKTSTGHFFTTQKSNHIPITLISPFFNIQPSCRHHVACHLTFCSSHFQLIPGDLFGLVLSVGGSTRLDLSGLRQAVSSCVSLHFGWKIMEHK